MGPLPGGSGSGAWSSPGCGSSIQLQWGRSPEGADRLVLDVRPARAHGASMGPLPGGSGSTPTGYEVVKAKNGFNGAAPRRERIEEPATQHLTQG